MVIFAVHYVNVYQRVAIAYLGFVHGICLLMAARVCHIDHCENH